MPRERKTWYMMIARCHDTEHKSYHQYGGLGVTVCDRWRESFEAFIEDMGRRPVGKTLDRIGASGNYEPGNCKWSTAEEQASNKRNSVKIEHGGEKLTIAQWARRLNAPYNKIHYRVSRGWSIEKIMSSL